VIACVLVIGTYADKAAVIRPTAVPQDQSNLQAGQKNTATNQNNVASSTNQMWTDVNGMRWDLGKLHLVDAKRIVDHITTNIPRIFTWRSWNHWLDGSKDNLKKGFDGVLSGEGMAFADKSFVLKFRTAYDASDINKELVTSSWTSPSEKCPPSQDCRYFGILIFDAESRPVASLFWQAADKQFVRTYKDSAWIGVETTQFDRWYRFIQKSQDQNAPKLKLPKQPLAPDQAAALAAAAAATTAANRQG